MKKIIGEEKGITLLALVILIIVLGILVSVATVSGVESINSAKLTRFTSEMEQMQTEVNELYEQVQNGNIQSNSIGKDISYSQDIVNQANVVFTSSASGITNRDGYRYYDESTLNSLGVEDMQQTFFVNIEERSVVSFEGLEYEGTTYYTLEQLPDSLYNVEYNDKNTGKPSITGTKVDNISNNKWRITIEGINYSGNIDKWEVKYKLQGSDYESTSDNLSFVVDNYGTYEIYVQNGDVMSDTIAVKIDTPTRAITKPNKATAQISSTQPESDGSIKEIIHQTHSDGTIDFSKCKWVYNTTSTEIGTDESLYTGGNLTSQDQEITLKPSETGVHYLHILTVDTNGNKIETIIRPMAFEVTTVNSQGTVLQGAEYQMTDATGKAVTTSTGATTVTSDNNGKCYLLFNQEEDSTTYKLNITNVPSGYASIPASLEVDILNNTVINEAQNDASNLITSNINEYGIIQATVTYTNETTELP